MKRFLAAIICPVCGEVYGTLNRDRPFDTAPTTRTLCSNDGSECRVVCADGRVLHKPAIEVVNPDENVMRNLKESAQKANSVKSLRETLMQLLEFVEGARMQTPVVPVPLPDWRS